MIEVLQPGVLSTIQDAGRTGYEAYGVPKSGMFDPFLGSVANKLVGNPFDTPLIEFALLGPTLRFHRHSTVAICGFGIEYEISGHISAGFLAIQVPAGSVLRFAGMKGWYGYIAVDGGIEAQKIMGSVSTYVAGSIGKRIQKDEILKTGNGMAQRFSLNSTTWSFPAEAVLHLLPAHHTSRFTSRQQERITEHSYKISSQSNRMGIRLDGATLEAPAIRRSVPALPGTVQITRSGSPIILGPEGPTTGGYAQIAVLSRISWTVLAGKRPGESVRFEWTDRDTARRMWQAREKLLYNESAWQPL